MSVFLLVLIAVISCFQYLGFGGGVAAVAAAAAAEAPLLQSPEQSRDLVLLNVRCSSIHRARTQFHHVE